MFKSTMLKIQHLQNKSAALLPENRHVQARGPRKRISANIVKDGIARKVDTTRNHWHCEISYAGLAWRFARTMRHGTDVLFGESFYLLTSVVAKFAPDNVNLLSKHTNSIETALTS